MTQRAQPGAGGVSGTPWRHGNRCPFEDPKAAGMFFGLTLETGKTEMIRAVVEGICYQLKWMLECQEKKVKTSDVLRFCGGGALSPVTAQILADITERVVEVPDSPQNVGSVGAALTAAVGLGILGSTEEIARLIPANRRFEPGIETREIYRRNYEVFKKLHRSNQQNFAAIRGE